MSSASAKSAKENLQPIRIFLRVKPLQDNEKRTTCLEVLNAKEIQANRTYQKKYCFDGIFQDDTKQLTLYTIIAKPLIQDILLGYNCTIFAYGQTGTGKTFTLLGNGGSLLPSFGSTNSLSNTSTQSDIDGLDVNAGLIPRTVIELFERVHLLRDPYTVRCSYLEIYNEELRDLLSAVNDPTALRIYDGQRGNGDVVIQGLESVTVHSEVDVFNLLKKTRSKRQQGDHSSNSHTIFSIIVDTRETSPVGEMLSKTGKLNFIDLAGSENLNRTAPIERRTKESTNLNQSLFTLGQVIKGLSEKNSFIPFRESKLTRILRDSLGGKTKSVFVATISFAVSNLNESLNTLDYVSKARTITSKPVINRRTSQKSLISQYVDEINALRRDLDAVQGGAGVVIDTDNYDKLMETRQTTDEQLAQALASINEFGKQLRMLEEEKEVFRAEWNALNKSFHETQKQLAKSKLEYAKIESEKEENEYVAFAYEKTAENLYGSARGLLEKVKLGFVNETTLREKIEYLYNVSNANNNNRKMISSKIQAVCENMVKEHKDYVSSSMSFNDKLTNATKVYYDHQTAIVSQLKDQLSSVRYFVQNAETVPHEKARLILRKCDEIQHKLFEDSVCGIEGWQRSNLAEFNSLAQNMLRPELEKSIKHVETLGKCVSTVYSQLPFDTISNRLETLKTEISQEINQLSSSLARQKEGSKEKLSSIVQVRDELVKAVNAKFDTLETQFKKDTEIDFRNLQLVQDLEKTIVGEIPKSCEEFDRYCRDVSVTISNELTQPTDTSAHSLCTVIDNYQSLADVLCLSAKEKLSQLGSEINGKSESFVNEAVTNLREAQNSLHTNVELLSDILNKQREIRPSKLDADICELMKDHRQEACNLFNTLSSKANEMKSLITHTSKYMVELKPTGNTPLRNQTETPCCLKELTPKEGILSRFHQSKKELENADVVPSSDHPAKKLFGD
ncbi:hypothetical protein RI129_005663 [Pyrocoelia pectoralis]|uniref:Kinesin-like protein n=1 Tax=Pyrocoelia pectoralis TaxID=417401 RepID=A0AAN7ZMC1_9COLE